MKTMKSNKGDKFILKKVKEYCENHEIQRPLTFLYSPQQNGVVKEKIELF